MMTDPLGSDSQSTPTPPSETGAAQKQSEPKAAPSLNPDGRLFFPAIGQGALSVSAEKNWAMLGHLGSLLGPFTLGFGYVIGPLVIYLWKKDVSPFVAEHAKESLNFGILTAVVLAISGAIGLVACIAWIPGAMALVFNLIFGIQGAIAAKNGQAIRFPFNWRIVK